jgi:hypothetical protein
MMQSAGYEYRFEEKNSSQNRAILQADLAKIVVQFIVCGVFWEYGRMTNHWQRKKSMVWFWMWQISFRLNYIQ